MGISNKQKEKVVLKTLQFSTDTSPGNYWNFLTPGSGEKIHVVELHLTLISDSGSYSDDVIVNIQDYIGDYLYGGANHSIYLHTRGQIFHLPLNLSFPWFVGGTDNIMSFNHVGGSGPIISGFVRYYSSK